jgi:hypothetical protein
LVGREACRAKRVAESAEESVINEPPREDEEGYFMSRIKHSVYIYGLDNVEVTYIRGCLLV